MISIIHNANSGFYVFDSHARNSFGMPDINGSAVLLNLRNIFSLQNYLRLLATALNATFFEVVSVTFHNLNSSESQEFTPLIFFFSYFNIYLFINPRTRKISTDSYIESVQQHKLKKLRQFVASKRKNAVNLKDMSDLQNSTA